MNKSPLKRYLKIIHHKTRARSRSTKIFWRQTKVM
jgi:hypothetical protein